MRQRDKATLEVRSRRGKEKRLVRQQDVKNMLLKQARMSFGRYGQPNTRARS